MSKGEPSGLHLWFDPMIEFPRLYLLEPQAKRGVLADVREDGRVTPDDVIKNQIELLPQEDPHGS